MRHLNGVYTQRYNRDLKIDGPLFRGRYKAQLIEEDSYQLLISRYIHLNPVKAKMVVKPAEYPWSSYRAYLGLVKAPTWLRGCTNWPRFVAIYLSRKYFGYSLREIAHFFGGMSYVTVSTVVQKCERLLKNQHNRYCEIEAIYNSIKLILQRDI